MAAMSNPPSSCVPVKRHQHKRFDIGAMEVRAFEASDARTSMAATSNPPSSCVPAKRHQPQNGHVGTSGPPAHAPVLMPLGQYTTPIKILLSTTKSL